MTTWNGSGAKLSGWRICLQEKYGYTPQHAVAQSDRWMRSHQDDPPPLVRQTPPQLII